MAIASRLMVLAVLYPTALLAADGIPTLDVAKTCRAEEGQDKASVAQCMKDVPGVLVAASDYLKVLPDSVDQWMPRRMRSLGIALSLGMSRTSNASWSRPTAGHRFS